MSVYFVHCEQANAVKIGFAADPWKRFSKIQSDSPGKLHLLAIEDGNQEREAELHQQFASLRSRGEWFDFAPSLRAHVASLPQVDNRRRLKALKGPLGKWMNANRVTMRDMAALLDVSAAAVCCAVNGQNIPAKETVRRIFEVTRGAVQPNDFYDLPELAAEQ